MSKFTTASALLFTSPNSKGKMYQIGRKFRHVSRWLGMLAGGVVVAIAAIAVALPFLVDAEAVRENLARSLSAWSGGPVVISGPLRIASVADLSVEASGVLLKSTAGLELVSRADAQSVTAVVRLSSLLGGKLEFKKFVVASPRIVLRRGLADPFSSSYGLGAARLALALSARSPFADVELLDPVFFVGGSGKGPYRRAELDRVRLGKEAAASVSTGVFVANAPGAASGHYALDVSRKDFAASFRGQCTSACQTAFGTFRLKASLNKAAGNTLLASMAPWERPDIVAVSADLNWSKGRAALDNAVISFGDHGAKGSLALDLTGSRPRLEGTIAYDTLDVTPAWMAGARPISTAKMPPLAALPFADAGIGPALDFDLRVSADRFRAGSFETGPVALALTAKPDRLSVDIATMALYGGNATGRLDINPSLPARLSVRGSGTQLDPRALASAFRLPPDFSGPVSVQVGMTMPLTTKPAADNIRAAEGTFAIRFPAGGSLQGKMAGMLAAALVEQDFGWAIGGRSFPFDAAHVDGTMKPGGIDLKIEGQSGEKAIAGSLRISMPGAEVSGMLIASENADALPPLASGDAQHASSTQLVLSGTADALILSSSGKPSFSN